MDIVEIYINSNDKVLIISFSFGEEIVNDIDWQNVYNRDKENTIKVLLYHIWIMELKNIEYKVDKPF